MNNQSLRHSGIQLEYIICDGGSNDGTVEKAHEITSGDLSENVTVHIMTENDHGMYDAVAKGVRLGTGDIFSYINAGDFYSPHVFDVMSEMFQKPEVGWVTGMTVIYNEKSHIVRSNTPYRYRKRFIQRGLYGRFLPYIQQESTFWRARLNQAIDLEAFAKLKLAGDYYLWNTFSQFTDLRIVESWIGGFRVHPGQLSSNHTAYNDEVLSFTKRPLILDYLGACLDVLLWYSPSQIKKMFNREFFYTYNQKKQVFE